MKRFVHPRRGWRWADTRVGRLFQGQRIRRLPKLQAPSQEPVFCIVDPSLRDFAGHHFAYDKSISSAAEGRGYRVVVLGHRDAIPAVAEAVNLRRSFRRDIWAFHSSVRSQADAGGRLAALRGILDYALCIGDFVTDMRAGLAELELPSGSVIFCHMLTTKQLAGFARFLSRQQRQGENVSVVLLLRYQLSLYNNPVAALAFRRLEKLAAGGQRIRLASDSGRLASAISRLTSLAIEVFSIPHTASIQPVREARPLSRCVRFVTLGNARDEKGILEILEAIRILQTEPDGLSGLQFVLQSNNPWPASVEGSLAHFSANLPPEVMLLRSALEPKEYEAALAAADVLLLPYWRSIYEARTSGVFLEAVSAGKPVIATGDTWMSDELQEHGAGLLVPDRNPQALAAAIREAARDISVLTSRAEAARSAVRARHSAEALVDQCLGRASALPNPPRPPRRVGILYPWGDFGDRRAGASRRSGLMLDVVAPLVEEVRVLHAGWGPDRRDGNVAMIAAPPRSRLHWARRIFRLAVRPLLRRVDRGQELFLWWHLERRLDPRFRRQVRDLVRWSDAVLLEYSFWAWAVEAECRRQRRHVPFILTAYDVLADGVTGSALLRRLTLSREIEALKNADHAVCVSTNDAETFAAHGIAATVIPNPADLDAADADWPIEARTLLELLFDQRVPSGQICLFVGSDYEPNRDAVARIRALARVMPSEVGATFVLAGGCAPAGRDGNVLAVGRVDDEALGALYRLATVVVIPLPQGTGSSLKTVEAMAWGCPILGTSTAFRGLPVTPGLDCEQEDDMSRWPARLAALLADQAMREAIGAAGRRLSESYGHRRVFAAYSALLGLPAASDPASDAAKGRRRRELGVQRALLERAIERGQLGLARVLLDRLLESQIESAEMATGKARREC